MPGFFFIIDIFKSVTQNNYDSSTYERGGERLSSPVTPYTIVRGSLEKSKKYIGVTWMCAHIFLYRYSASRKYINPLRAVSPPASLSPPT